MFIATLSGRGVSRASRALLTAAISVGCVLVSAAPAAAGAPSWTVDHGKSSLSFTATQNGESFTGRFGKWTAEIAFDPDDLTGSRLVVTVDLASAATGDRQRDRAIPGRDWFDIRNSPTAVYAANVIAPAADGGGGYVAAGELSLRGVRRPLPLGFMVEMNGDDARAAGAATILRTDFGVGQGEFADGRWVGVEVIVEFDISATKTPAP